MIEMIDVVDVLKANKDAWGVNADSAIPTTYKARVFYRSKAETYSLADGTQITPIAKIYFPNLVNIEMKDRIRFVDDFGVIQTYKINELRVIKDFNGTILFTRVDV